MQELLLAIIKGHIDNPENVRIEVETQNPQETVYHIVVSEEDKGRIIGQHGSKIRAVRTIMDAVAAKQGKRIRVEVD